MTEDEAIAKLGDIMSPKDYDREIEHHRGDALISEFLRSNGFERLANHYDGARSGWWYA